MTTAPTRAARRRAPAPPPEARDTLPGPDQRPGLTPGGHERPPSAFTAPGSNTRGLSAAGWIALGLAALSLLGCPAEEKPLGELTPCQNLIQLQRRAGRQISSDAPGAGTLEAYTITEGGATAKIPNPCGDALAERLTSGACPFCNENGTLCENMVRGLFESPPPECATCGDGICTGSEDAATCPQDCQTNCGDGICDEGETEEECPLDCRQPCGDGICAGAETDASCPQDCNYTSGDGLCGNGENPRNSPQDCRGSTCNAPGTCAEQCNAEGVCVEVCIGGEGCQGVTCDLGVCARVCDDQGGCAADCIEAGLCADLTCGDGFCQSYEDTFNCPADCCDQACSGVGRDAVACAGRDVVRCNPEGPGNCPEVEVLESCPNGCRDGACVVCPDFVERCSADTPNTCANNTVLRACQPVAGFEGCSQLVFFDCAEQNPFSTCREGQCTNSCPPDVCQEGTSRCVDGTRVQRCATPQEASCPVFSTVTVCDEGLRCDRTPSAVCTAEGDVVEAPNAPQVEAMAPSHGIAGDTVVLTGQSLGLTGEVLFSRSAPAQIVSWTETRVEVIVPDRAISGPVTLNNARGTSAAPVLFSIVPRFTETLDCAWRGTSTMVFGQSINGVADLSATFSPNEPARVLSQGQTFNSRAYVEVEVPVGAQSGPLTMTTAGGDTTLPGEVEIIDPPLVPLRPRWPIPDSPTARCVDAQGINAACPEPGAALYGQDGNFQTPGGLEIVDEAVARDPLTGLQWHRVVEIIPETIHQARCRCDALVAGGFDDWRLPASFELVSIADLGRSPNEVLDPAIFNTNATEFWALDRDFVSSSPVTFAFTVGSGFTKSRLDSANTLCVRGGPQQPAAARYVAQGATVLDQETGLMWTRDLVRQPHQWPAALAYCEGLTLDGHDDWHLPNIKELQSLFDVQSDAALDHRFFGRDCGNHWSSTPGAVNSPQALTIGCPTGLPTRLLFTASAFTRCVRRATP